MQLTYYFEVVSDVCTTIDIEEDELEKPWDEMTEDEKRAVVLNHEDEAYYKASYESDESLGELTMAEDETGEDLYKGY